MVFVLSALEALHLRDALQSRFSLAMAFFADLRRSIALLVSLVLSASVWCVVGIHRKGSTRWRLPSCVVSLRHSSMSNGLSFVMSISFMGKSESCTRIATVVESADAQHLASGALHHALGYGARDARESTAH